MSKPTILVVDDSPTVRQQVALALGEAGFAIVEATDGLEGLDAIHKNPGIALVILDVNMPNMNGLEMLEKLQEEGEIDRLSVVMLTTEGHPDLIRRAKQAGAKGWIVKPFKADQLVAAADKLTAVPS